MRNLFELTCLCALSLSALSGCSEGSQAPATYDFSAVDSAANDFMDAYGVSGLTLAVVHRSDGQVHAKGYGEFGPDRITLIRSTGKVLSAGVILSLVDDGLLELDRPVGEYLDWGDHHPSVTIRSLLSMMSGIPEDDLCFRDPSTTLRECGRAIFQDESQSVPAGEKFQYSGDAWQLAGAVAEVVSGKTWDDLVEERLVAPCGLTDTGYRNFGATVPYPGDLNGDPASIAPSENPNVGGGAYSTINDYSKVLSMHLHDGLCEGQRVLSTAMVHAMREALVPEGVVLPPWRPEALNYGMGWWWFEEAPALLVDTGAWGARSVIHPEEGWGAILIIEANTLLGTIMYRDIVPLIRAAVLEAN